MGLPLYVQASLPNVICVMRRNSRWECSHTDNIFLGGGVPTTKNRTYWPTTGGAVAFQPGWFRGHEKAFVQVNLGFGTDGPDNGPKDMANPMIKPIQILGPTNGPYPGTVCFPQVPLPKDAEVKAGDLATIQVVEHAVHGAALYSVRLSISGEARTS